MKNKKNKKKKTGRQTNEGELPVGNRISPGCVCVCV